MLGREIGKYRATDLLALTVYHTIEQSYHLSLAVLFSLRTFCTGPYGNILRYYFYELPVYYM